MKFTPTQEQQAAMDFFQTGQDLVIEAGAGTGKTATLLMLAEKAGRGRGQYVAFNKAIVEEGKNKFPSHVACNTAHSLAFRAVGKRYSERLNGSRRQRDTDVARILDMQEFGLTDASGKPKVFPKGWLAGRTMLAVANFCMSADMQINASHFDYVPNIDPVVDGKQTFENNRAVVEYLLPYANRAWDDLMQTDPIKGRLAYGHQHYLKAWQLSGPVINADYIFFDEAQDANPVMLACVVGQENAQKILVGDSQQQIYEFTGAVNALQKTGIENKAFLSQSFRFGPAIANEANRVLAALNAELRLKGLESIPSSVGDADQPDCFLSRTNATAVRRMIEEGGRFRKAHLMGGGMDIKMFCEAAQKLQNGQPTDHRDLALFSSWSALQEYIDTDSFGFELRLNTRLVDDFGADTILRTLENMPSNEKWAQLVVSTAHKAKGREWRVVELADDFPIPEDGAPLEEAELRLVHVALTRATHLLDSANCGLLHMLPDAAVQSKADPEPTIEITGSIQSLNGAFSALEWAKRKLGAREQILLRRSTNGGGTMVTGVDHRITHHSPDGFEWGYGGSGPADLALNIAEEALMRTGWSGERMDCNVGECFTEAWNMHQPLKWSFLSGAPKAGHVIEWASIDEWVSEWLKEAETVDNMRF